MESVLLAAICSDSRLETSLTFTSSTSVHSAWPLDVIVTAFTGTSTVQMDTMHKATTKNLGSG